MCRHAFSYRTMPFACFDCRVCFDSVTVCPHCHQKMHAMGLDFKPPAKRNIKQWRKVEVLYRNGFAYGSCGCNGPGYRPARLNQVEAFLEAPHWEMENRKTDGLKLLEKWDKQLNQT